MRTHRFGVLWFPGTVLSLVCMCHGLGCSSADPEEFVKGESEINASPIYCCNTSAATGWAACTAGDGKATACNSYSGGPFGVSPGGCVACYGGCGCRNANQSDCTNFGCAAEGRPVVRAAQ